MAPKRPSRAAKRRAGAPLALKDAIATAAFVFGVALIGPLAWKLSPQVGLAPELSGLVLLLVLLVVMGAACEAAGGALFNPANNAFLYATGMGSLRHHVVRGVAQMAGGVAGALLARTALPPAWTKDLGTMAIGLRMGVPLADGMACEFVLGSLLAFAILWSSQSQSVMVKLWVPLMATVAAVMSGAHLTGPSLNPAVAFTFNFLYPTQTTQEHLLVFWVAPLASGLFGGWAFMGHQHWKAQGAAQQAGAGKKQGGKSD